MPRIVLAFLIAAGCAPAAQPPSNTVNVQNTSVVESLRAAGLTVKDAGSIDQSFFSVPAHVYVVEGDDLQVYEYPTEAAARDDAAKVDASGSSIGTNMVTWMAPPHFFRRGATIVNYLGSNERVLEVLRRELGPQFAGR